MRSLGRFATPKRLSASVKGSHRCRQVHVTNHTHVCQALVLRPIGDGTLDHLELPEGTPTGAITLPGAFVLPEGKLVVGRAAESDIHIDLPTVSSRHAMFEIDGKIAVIADLKSTNGTNINGLDLEPLEPYSLPVGSVVVFGDVHLAMFVLEDTEEEEAAAAAAAAAVVERENSTEE